MTSPNIAPFSYVFTPVEAGGTALRAPGQVYASLPEGVSTLILTWWGRTYCRLQLQPTGSGGGDRNLIFLPDVDSVGHRQRVIQVASDDPNARLYLRTGAGETMYRAGVTIIPTPRA